MSFWLSLYSLTDKNEMQNEKKYARKGEMITIKTTKAKYRRVS